MWILYCVIVGILLCLYRWLGYKRVSPICKNGGVLPPGSMGLPLIGETIQLIIPSYSLDIHPFFQRRVQRYGSIFRTCLVGQPIVISMDPEFNNYILQQEGKLTELWYLRTFSKLLSLESDSQLRGVGQLHVYVRGILMKAFGSEVIRDKILPQLEETARKSLGRWSGQSSVDVKRAAFKMIFDLSAKLLFSYDSDTSSEDLSKGLVDFFPGLVSFPFNLPGTTYRKCLKVHESLTESIGRIVRERIVSGSRTHNDLLDQTIDDMKNREVVTEDILVQLIFVTLFASAESLSGATTILLKLISDNKAVVEQLKDEHASILHKRGKLTSMEGISWDEYKSMGFTNQVVNETLRLANLVPGVFRRAIKDIHIKGMTIPAGWSIMLAVSGVHMNQDIFSCPSEFNPWRWKELDTHMTPSRNLMPFGGGRRQCPGADYSRAFLCIFLHVLVTEFSWTKIKGGTVCRSPFLGFKDGFEVEFTKLATMGM